MPTVGRTVHYVSLGSAGGEYPSVCRAAIVTESGDRRSADADLAKVGLCVLNPEGLFFNRGVSYSTERKPGTWHHLCGM